MIQLERRDDGVVLPVRAQAGARANELKGEHDGSLKVAVTQVAEKGKANKAICQVLKTTLSLKAAQIELISGHTAAQKRFLIRDIGLAELRARLTTALA